MEEMAISEQLIELLPDALFVVDQNGMVVFANARAERIFGYTRAEIVGQSVDTLVPQEAREVHAQHRARFVEEDQVRPMGADLGLSGRRKDGTLFPAEISLSTVAIPGGHLITAVVRDVTERKRTEAKFEGLLEACGCDGEVVVVPRGPGAADLVLTDGDRVQTLGRGWIAYEDGTRAKSYGNRDVRAENAAVAERSRCAPRA